MTIYLTIDEVQVFHEHLIQLYGGKRGILNRDGIESALGRPQSGYYENLLEEAAALLESLCNNHGFVDGNKRVAIAVVYVFLKLNGYLLTVASLDAYNEMNRMFEQKKVRYEFLLEWLKANTKVD